VRYLLCLIGATDRIFWPKRFQPQLEPVEQRQLPSHRVAGHEDLSRRNPEIGSFLQTYRFFHLPDKRQSS
jgi:hypothetical protein